MTGVLTVVGGLLLRALIGIGAMLALLAPALAIVGARLLWEHHRHANTQHP